MSKKRKKTKKRVCKYCGGIFKDAIALEEHHRANLHQIFHKVKKVKEKDIIVCEICKERFPDFDLFYKHWNSDYQHDDIAWSKYRFRIKTPDKGRWTVHPFWKRLIARHIREDKHKRRKKDYNATHLLIEGLEYGFDEESYNIVMVVGPSGHGKSRVALLLAQWMQDYIYEKNGTEPEVIFTRNMVETQFAFPAAAKHDIILQDESPTLAGGGAKTFAANMGNLLESMRAAEVNIVYCCPFYIEELKSHQIIFEVYGRDKKRRVTKGYVYDPERIMLGYGIIKILPEDNELEKRYKFFKLEMVARMKASAGAVSGHMPEEKIAADTRLIQEAVKRHHPGKDPAKLPILVYQGLAELYVDGNVAHQKNIAWAAKEKYKDIKKGLEEGTGMIQEARGVGDAWLPKIEVEGRYERPDILQAIYDHAKPMTERHVRGLEFYRLCFVEGELQEDATELINKMFAGKYEPTSRQAYRDMFASVFQKGGPLGEGGEKAIREEFYIEGTHFGGHGEPDIVIGHPDNPTKVIEVKTRRLESDGHIRPLRDLVKEEVYLKKYIEMRVPIDIVSVYYSKKRCIVTIGHVVYEDEEF